MANVVFSFSLLFSTFFLLLFLIFFLTIVKGNRRWVELSWGSKGRNEKVLFVVEFLFSLLCIFFFWIIWVPHNLIFISEWEVRVRKEEKGNEISPNIAFDLIFFHLSLSSFTSSRNFLLSLLLAFAWRVSFIRLCNFFLIWRVSLHLGSAISGYAFPFGVRKLFKCNCNISFNTCYECIIFLFSFFSLFFFFFRKKSVFEFFFLFQYPFSPFLLNNFPSLCCEIDKFSSSFFFLLSIT